MGTASMIILFSGICGVLGAAAALGLLWMLAQQGERAYPATLLSIPAQEGIPEKVAVWAKNNGYIAQLTEPACQQYVKGKGWLTSSTLLTVEQKGDKHWQLDIREMVNLLVARKLFAIDAPILLGQPVRAHKIKTINHLLQSLNMPLLQIQNKSKRVAKRVKKAN